MARKPQTRQPNRTESSSASSTSSSTSLQPLEEKWNSKCKLMKELAQEASSTLTLNIGGTLFQTSKDTLLSNKDAFFFAMISSGEWIPDEDGAYFVDRNPNLFPYILDLLRYGKVDLSKLDENQLELLKIEADYYLVKDVMFTENEETFDTDTKGRYTILSENNKRAHASHSGHTCAIGVNGISSGKKTWKIRMNHFAMPSQWISVGVICKPITDLQYTYGNPTNYSITSSTVKFSAGKSSSTTASNDWNVGHIVQIDLDCDLHTLTIKNLNTGKSELFNNLPVNTYYLHVNMYNTNDSVSIV